jgi:hypothetical protein
MTLMLADGVGRCPRCDGAVTFMSFASIAAHDVQSWTDGWTGIDDGWVRCPHCTAVMTSREMKAGRAPKAASADPQFAGAPELGPPSAQELQATLAKLLETVPEGSEEERRARIALWRSMNHARRRGPDAPLPTQAEEQNLKRLGSLMGSFHPRASALPTKGLLRVEILRELGRFAAAKAALRRARAEIEALEKLVDAGDRRVRPMGARVDPWDGYPEEVAADMRAGEAGDGDAAMRVSRRFDTGDGVPEDHEASLQWMQRAIRAGSAAARSRAGIEELRAGELHFGAALAQLLPAARSGDEEARAALGIGAELPPECARGIAFLGERGTPQSVDLLLGYLEVVRSPGEPAQEGTVAFIREALAQLVKRLGDVLPEAQREACSRELATSSST